MSGPSPHLTSIRHQKTGGVSRLFEFEQGAHLTFLAPPHLCPSTCHGNCAAAKLHTEAPGRCRTLRRCPLGLEEMTRGSMQRVHENTACLCEQPNRKVEHGDNAECGPHLEAKLQKQSSAFLPSDKVSIKIRRLIPPPQSRAESARSRLPGTPTAKHPTVAGASPAGPVPNCWARGGVASLSGPQFSCRQNLSGPFQLEGSGIHDPPPEADASFREEHRGLSHEQRYWGSQRPWLWAAGLKSR